MPAESCFLVSVERFIAVDRQRLFDIVADPAQHPIIDGGGTVKRARTGGPERLGPGVKFGMDMHLGTDYRILNTVVEFDEPSALAWRHFNGHVWRYLFTEVTGGTKVTEQWDARNARNRWFLLLVGFPRRNRAGMERTLRRLADLVATA